MPRNPLLDGWVEPPAARRPNPLLAVPAQPAPGLAGQGVQQPGRTDLAWLPPVVRQAVQPDVILPVDVTAQRPTGISEQGLEARQQYSDIINQAVAGEKRAAERVKVAQERAAQIGAQKWLRIGVPLAMPEVSPNPKNDPWIAAKNAAADYEFSRRAQAMNQRLQSYIGRLNAKPGLLGQAQGQIQVVKQTDEKSIPFWGDLVQLADTKTNVTLLKKAQQVGVAGLTDAELDYIAALTNTARMAQVNPETIGGMATRGLRDMVKYAVEFGVTSGVGDAVASRLGLTQAQLVQQLAGKALPKAAKVALIKGGVAVGGMAGGAVQSLMNVPAVIEAATKRQAPQFSVGIDVATQRVKKLIVEHKGDPWLEAALRGTGARMAEFAGERLGFVVDDAIAALIVKKGLAKYGVRGLHKFISDLAAGTRKFGVGSALGENFEEWATELMQAPLEKRDLQFSPEQLLVTALVVSIPGMPGTLKAAADAIASRQVQSRAAVLATQPPSPAADLERAVAVQQGYAGLQRPATAPPPGGTVETPIPAPDAMAGQLEALRGKIGQIASKATRQKAEALLAEHGTDPAKLAKIAKTVQATLDKQAARPGPAGAKPRTEPETSQPPGGVSGGETGRSAATKATSTPIGGGIAHIVNGVVEHPDLPPIDRTRAYTSSELSDLAAQRLKFFVSHPYAEANSEISLTGEMAKSIRGVEVAREYAKLLGVKLATSPAPSAGTEPEMKRETSQPPGGVSGRETEPIAETKQEMKAELKPPVSPEPAVSATAENAAGGEADGLRIITEITPEVAGLPTHSPKQMWELGWNFAMGRDGPVYQKDNVVLNLGAKGGSAIVSQAKPEPAPPGAKRQPGPAAKQAGASQAGTAGDADKPFMGITPSEEAFINDVTARFRADPKSVSKADADRYFALQKQQLAEWQKYKATGEHPDTASPYYIGRETNDAVVKSLRERTSAAYQKRVYDAIAAAQRASQASPAAGAKQGLAASVAKLAEQGVKVKESSLKIAVARAVEGKGLDQQIERMTMDEVKRGLIRAEALRLAKAEPGLTGREMLSARDVSAMPDAELVRRAQSGDEEAFSDLMRRYERKVYAVAYGHVGNRMDAEEVKQDTFVKAYREIGKFRGESSVGTWLHRIAINTSLSKVRARSAQKRGYKETDSTDAPVSGEEGSAGMEIPDVKYGPERMMKQREMRAAIQDAVDGLSPVARNVFTMSEYEDMSNEEIAEALDMSLPAVKSQLHRARLALRAELSPWLERMMSARSELPPDMAKLVRSLAEGGRNTSSDEIHQIVQDIEQEVANVDKERVSTAGYDAAGSVVVDAGRTAAHAGELAARRRSGAVRNEERILRVLEKLNAPGVVAQFHNGDIDAARALQVAVALAEVDAELGSDSAVAKLLRNTEYGNMPVEAEVYAYAYVNPMTGKVMLATDARAEDVVHEDVVHVALRKNLAAFKDFMGKARERGADLRQQGGELVTLVENVMGQLPAQAPWRDFYMAIIRAAGDIAFRPNAFAIAASWYADNPGKAGNWGELAAEESVAYSVQLDWQFAAQVLQQAENIVQPTSPAQLGGEAGLASQRTRAPPGQAAQGEMLSAKPGEPADEFDKLRRELEGEEAGEGGAVASPEPPIVPSVVVDKLIGIVKSAKPLRGALEADYTKERGRRIAAVRQMMTNVGSKTDWLAVLGRLKGPLAKQPSFEPPEGKLSAPEIKALIQMVTMHPILDAWEKVSAMNAFTSLIEGRIPGRRGLELMEEVYGPALVRAMMTKRPWFSRALDVAMDILNLPRALMATADMSAVLRQAAVETVAHPIVAVKSLSATFRFAFHPKTFEAYFQTDLPIDPLYKLMRDSCLAITDPSHAVASELEEAFMSRLLRRIPVIGHVMGFSERAYVGYLTKMRVDLFHQMADELLTKGMTFDSNPKEFRALADIINTFTGRGDLNMVKFRHINLNDFAPALNTVFFSPRLQVARFQALNPIWYAKMPSGVRRRALLDFAKFVASGIALLMIAKLSGLADVEANPLSSDFGKIRIGNTRWDVWGGHQQWVRMMAQVLFGRRKSLSTGEVVSLTKDRYPFTTRKDVVYRFVEGKAAPVPGLVLELMTGKDATGEPIRVEREAARRLIPLYVQDIAEAYGDGGLARAVGVGIPAFFGVGAQTYGEQDSFGSAPASPNLDFLNAAPGQPDLQPGPSPDFLNAR